MLAVARNCKASLCRLAQKEMISCCYSDIEKGRMKPEWALTLLTESVVLSTCLKALGG
jgi:hypothetical protein